VSTQPESGSKEKETEVRVSPSTNSGRGSAAVPVTIVVDDADKSESVCCQLRCAVLTCCRRVRRRSELATVCWAAARDRHRQNPELIQDPGPCGAAGSTCRDCRPIVATAWELIGQKGCRAGAGNAAACPSRHRCFGKRAQQRTSTGSPDASAVSVRM
jgi:hypothetical protein